MSLKKSDLWIGDRLQELNSGKIGILIGLASGNEVQIDFDGDKRLVDLSVLKVVPEEADNSKSDLIKELLADESSNNIIKDVQTEIDLHINKLRPDLSQANPDRIRDIQVKACTDFLNQAVHQKLGIIKIIHGKGKGVLKNEVLHLIKLLDQYHFHTSANDGGALEVWFRYDA